MRYSLNFAAFYVFHIRRNALINQPNFLLLFEKSCIIHYGLPNYFGLGSCITLFYYLIDSKIIRCTEIDI